MLLMTSRFIEEATTDRRSFSKMSDRGLPPRPGEHLPGDVGKKGGDVPEGDGTIVDEPTGLPGRKPDVGKGPIQQPTI